MDIGEHDSHTLPCSKEICQVVVRTRAGEVFAASASAKQKPVHCAAMIARKFNDKNAGSDSVVLPPDDKTAHAPRRSEDEEEIDLDPVQLTILTQKGRNVTQVRGDSMLKLTANRGTLLCHQ